LNVVSDMVQPCSVTTMAKMDGTDAGVETRAPSWGRWLRYIIIRQLWLHFVRGYWTADIGVTINCAEMNNMNCESVVRYTRLKYHVQWGSSALQSLGVAWSAWDFRYKVNKLSGGSALYNGGFEVWW